MLMSVQPHSLLAAFLLQILTKNAVDLFGQVVNY